MAAGSAPGPVRPPRPRPGRAGDVHVFWNRLSEGMALDQLWSQFLSEARSTYGFYSKDLKHEDVEHLPHGHRVWGLIKQIFWAIVLKLSPARRVLFVAALLLIVVPRIFWPTNPEQAVVFFGAGPAVIGGLLALVLLVLEIADRVTMKRDLEIAREIQRWLVPSVAPEIPGLDIGFASRPANTVAGDYYDVVPLPGEGKEVLLVVADVAGKSLPAALLMATFQASLRTLAKTIRSVNDLMKGINIYCCDFSQGGQRFTTAFVTRLELESGTLTFSNAGHNAPILMHANGDIDRLETGGIPMGILPAAVYQSASIQLEPGAMLMIFTDGLTEAVNDRGEEYEEDRLKAVLRGLTGATAQGAVDAVMKDIAGFVGFARQHDDMTCMVVRRK